MKLKLTAAVFGISSLLGHAAMETWTDKEGRKAEMDLKKVTTQRGEVTAEFLTRGGVTVSLKSGDLSADSQQRVSQWKPDGTAGGEATTAADAGEASVFDRLLDGNLEKLDGKTVKRYAPEAKPAKYYVFYYSASWCVPCHNYTPSLVAWYEKLKPANKDFELVLITSDSDPKSMEGYMKEMKMPWPALKMEKAEKFKSKFKHGVSGIPCVVVCKLDGTVVAKTQDLGLIERTVTAKN